MEKYSASFKSAKRTSPVSHEDLSTLSLCLSSWLSRLSSPLTLFIRWGSKDLAIFSVERPVSKHALVSKLLHLS